MGTGIEPYEKFYPMVKDACMAYFAATDDADAVDLSARLMEIEGLPMHCPVHHYIVPAALLTVCRHKQGGDAASLERELEEIRRRSLNVLPGFCGFYGTCGAAIGLGIFLSVVTESSPLSTETWGDMQRATGKALIDMAEMGGPRCCKRTTFATLRSALPQIAETLGLDVARKAPIICRYHERSAECLKDRCPFYPQ